jgi:hypothetical protein
MTLLDGLVLALLIIVPFAAGIAPLLLPRRYLRPWGAVLSILTISVMVTIIVVLRDVPYPYHLMAVFPFAIGWLLCIALMPFRLRKS